MRFNRPGLLHALIIAIVIILVPAAVMAAPHPRNVLQGSLAPEGQDTPTESPNPQAGSESYAANCAPCHGATGGGDGPSAPGLSFPPTALSDYAAIADLSMQDWFDVTKNGRIERMMPPWSNRLTDQEIWDTVGYAWTLHTSRQQVEMGAAVYEQNCAACHGADGKGNNTPGMIDFTDFAATSAASPAEWAQVVANGRGTMPAFNGRLGDVEQRAALEYIRSLSMGPMFSAPVAAGQGVITGVVTNVTAGAPVPNLPVTLGIFDGAAMLEQREAVTDAAGQYRFEGLPTDPNVAYIARAEYPEAGLPYSSGLGQFAAGEAEISLPLSVYETTADASGVRADRVHYIVDLEPGRALIAELVVFSQDGNRSYIGDGQGVLRFTLPPGAEELSIDGGALGDDQRYVRTADGFVDRLPLPPGEGVRQVLYRYALPYEGTTLDLERSLPYPAAAVNVLATDQGQRVTSNTLDDQGRRTTEMGSFFNFSASDVPADRTISVQMSNLPSAGSAGSAPAGGSGGQNRALLFMLIGAVAAIAALLAAWPLLRRQDAVATTAATGDDALDALARLAAAYEAGEISETAYRDQRMRLKAQLLDAGADRPQ